MSELLKKFTKNTEQRTTLLIWCVLLLILIIGAVLRFNNLNWDEGTHQHPDERAIIWQPPDEGVMNLMTKPAPISDAMGEAGNYQADRVPVNFPPGGFSFFIPNKDDNLRPATDQETQAFFQAKASGQNYVLPPNVVPPDQPVPDDAINLWNAAYSPLNPHFFAYGSLPMYVIKLGAHFMTVVTGNSDWAQYDDLFLVGRFFSVLYSLGTILLVFLIGKRAFGPYLGRRQGEAIGLLAASFMSLSVIDIQLAHFLSFDEPLTFFITLTVYVAIGQMRNGSRWGAMRLGLALGLALASKFSSAPVAIVAGLAILMYGLYGNAKFSGERIGKPIFRPLPGEEHYGTVALGPRLIWRTFGNLIIMGVSALAAWFIGMPYAFLDFTNYSSRLIEEGGMARGVDSFPYTRQFVGSVPVVYQFDNIILWGVGIPVGILIVVGLVYSVWRCATARLKSEVLLWGWLLPYAIATFSFEAKFFRYNLPFIPLFVVLAARLVVEVYTRLQRGQKVLSWREPVPAFEPVYANVETPTLEPAIEDEEEAEPVAAYQSNNIDAVENESVSVAQEENVAEPEPVAASVVTYPKLSRSGKWLSRAVFAVAAFSILWSLVWALSFEQIYSRPFTRAYASEWMYKNIPANAKTSYEVWDDSLPLDIGGNVANNNNFVPFDLYTDRPPTDEANYLIGQIQQTDYIVEASNRLYATMPKLPWRYPVQMRYFDLLFNGNLGFQLVASFTDYPTIPGTNIQINDDSADESFTVYDHPKVLIFKKTQNLSDAQLHGLFEAITQAPWVPVRHLEPGQLPTMTPGTGDGALTSATAGEVQYSCKDAPADQPCGKSLLLDKPVDQLPVMDDIGWNKPANDQQWFGVILWFVLAQILGLVGLPLAIRTCGRLPDKGYILAKPIGAATVALIIWLLVSTRWFMNTVLTNYIGLGIGIVVSAWLWWRYRDEINLFFQQNRRLIIIEETLFLLAFVAMLFVRIGNPDLWHPTMGGEKPMELTDVYALLRSAYFPPYDPWFSDGFINYYYYGQYIFTTWMKMTGIEPGIAFNLCTPIIYAFTFTAGFSLVFNLTGLYERRRARLAGEIYPKLPFRNLTIAGIFGAFLFAVFGNFDSIVQVLQSNQQIVDFANKAKLYPVQADVMTQFDYWRSHLVFGSNNIDEFPFFSFLYGDFHANVIALPFTVVIMGLALNLISTNWLGYSEDGLSWWRRLYKRAYKVMDNTFLVPVVLAILLGLLGATNTWDLPTYLLLVGGCFFLALLRRPKITVMRDSDELVQRPKLALSSIPANLVLTAIFTGVLLAVGLLLYLNFYDHFQAMYSSVKLVTDAPFAGQTDYTAHTYIQYYIIFLGIPLFFILSYVIWNFWDWSRLRPLNLPEKADTDTEYVEPSPTPDLEPVSSKPAFARLKQPNLAFAMAGADGGFNNGGSDGANFGASGDGDLDWNFSELNNFNNQPPNTTGFNRFAFPWLLGLGLLAVGMLLFTAFKYEWGLLAMMIFSVAAMAVLLFVRLFDPDPVQAATARSAPGMLVKLMLLGSCAIAGMTEVIYLADDLQESVYERMNTIFKFYYQVWAMFAIAAGFGAYVFWTQVISPRLSNFNWRSIKFEDPFRHLGRYVWIGVAGILAVIGILYPLLGTPVKINERDADTNNKYCNIPTSQTEPMPFGLDGQAYLSALHCVVGMTNMQPGLRFDFKYDAAAIKDFYSKIPGTPVVLEAAIEPYRGGGTMVTINTGLPTVLGWDHHESQQRYPGQVYARSLLDCCMNTGDVRDIYNTSDISHALELLNHYHVTYIHVGVVEREAQVQTADISQGQPSHYEPYMSDAGYAKFDTMVKLGLLKIDYQNPGVTVYQMTTLGMTGVVDDKAAAAAGVSTTNPRLQALQDAVNRSPNDPIAHYNLGQYYESVKDYQKAAEQYQIEVNLIPNEVNPYQVLGDVYEKMGNMDLALQTYQKATQAAPDQPAAWNKVGLALVERNQLDAALVQFQQAAKVQPSFVEAYFHEGEIYQKQGKNDQAVQAYKQVVSKDTSPNDYWYQQAKIKLQALGVNS